MGKNMRALLLHNVVSPYRLPVFEVISKQIDLEVVFCKDKTADRKWNASLAGYTFKHMVLSDFKIGPFFINPTLVWHLIRHPYDVYLVGDFPEMAFATFATIAVAKLRRKPVVLWSETIDHDVIYFQNIAASTKRMHRMVQSTLTRLITGYRRTLLKMPDQYVALSDLARLFLIDEGVASTKIHSGIQVMPRELLDAPNVAKEDGPYAGKKLVLYLGYFNPLKGIDILIHAFGKINDPEARLAIVGTGPEELNLRRLAEGDKRVDFYGYTDGADRANLMSWASVFALPTLADCWAVVVNESLHYGTPVIITSAAGAAELLKDGQGGVIIPPRDEASLVAALEQVLSGTEYKDRVASFTKPTTPEITDSRVGARPILAALRAAGAAK